jgi:hypothetical protein
MAPQAQVLAVAVADILTLPLLMVINLVDPVALVSLSSHIPLDKNCPP